MSIKTERLADNTPNTGLTGGLGRFRPIKSFLSLRADLSLALAQDQRSIRILRFAVGVSLAIILAFIIEWPLSFLTPVLSAVVLALPLPAPSVRGSLQNMLYTLSAFLIGLVFTLYLLPYPLVYIPLLGIVLFKIYYYLNRGGSFWFTLMALLSVLIIPMLGNTADGLAIGFAMGFIWSGWLTIVMVRLAYFWFPDLDNQSAPPAKKFSAVYAPKAAEAALKSTLVVLPIAVTFITFNWTEQILVMVFAAIFTLAPDVSKGKVAGINSIKSTLIGGTSALIIYWLLVAVPAFYFFIALMFFAALWFAQKIFSGDASAGYFGSAFVAMFVLVNSSLDAGGDIGSALLYRVIFISLAAIYVVSALNVLTSYWPKPAPPRLPQT